MVKNPVVKSEDKLRKQIRELKRENNHLKSLLLIDELTGLYNKRFFYIQLEVETARTRRTGQPCTLMMMDVDNFKLLNDTYGHDVGDRFLIHIAEIIKKDLRPTDFACRFGGDEFSIIMPSSNLSDSFRIAKRIQNSVMQLASSLHMDMEEPLTTSFGLASYEERAAMSVVDTFFKQADLELYGAEKSEEPLKTGFGLATHGERSSTSVDIFFKQADLELYEAKKAGKNQISFGRVKRAESTAVSEAEKVALAKPLPRIE
jgi:two-component system, cell cycle response regulator